MMVSPVDKRRITGEASAESDAELSDFELSEVELKGLASLEAVEVAIDDFFFLDYFIVEPQVDALVSCQDACKFGHRYKKTHRLTIRQNRGYIGLNVIRLGAASRWERGLKKRRLRFI